MVINPFGMADDLLKFLDLPHHKLIDKFIKQHTNKTRGVLTPSYDTAIKSYDLDIAKKENPARHSTFRKHSTARAFLWRKQLDKKDIAKIQRKCKTLIKMLGYNSV